MFYKYGLRRNEENCIKRVQNAYDKLNIKKGEHVCVYREYAEGLVGDVGDLMKMIMAKSNLRGYSGDLDHDIKHEIADCV